MKRLLTLVLCTCYYFTICSAQIAGPWHGIVNLGTQKLPIVFNISIDDDKYTVTMDSPMQGAKGIPADIEEANDTISIAIPMIGATYRGVLADGVITGELRQHGVKLPITLEQGEYVAPRPQTPMPPYPYITREVTFVNPADGYQLHGTLTLPLMYKPYGKNRYNAVVMVTGSGTQNRDEEIFGHKPFAVIANALALNGIASLRYDDRGYREEGLLPGITTATNASDAKAAVTFMHDSVAALGNVGMLGHSEGGTIAFMLAADGDADFVVSLAGAAVKGDSILLKQNERTLQSQLGAILTSQYVTALSRTLDFMQRNPGATEWGDIDAVMADLKLPHELVDNLKAVVQSRTPWLDYFISYDPTEAIERVAEPVYAANGDLDVQVDSRQNLGALRGHLPVNQASVLKEYPGLNHLMQEANTGMPTEYGEIEQTISPALLQDIVNWIKSLPVY